MIKKNDFKIGKLYYHCSWSLGKYPVPEIEAYILEQIDEGGYHFIGPAILNAKEPLDKLDDNDRYAILNMLDKNRTLFVPHDEIENIFVTPEGAIEFLRDSFKNGAISSLI